MFKKIFYFTGVIAVITSVLIISSCPEASSKSKLTVHYTKYSGNPIYWSKCESVANIATIPEIQTGTSRGLEGTFTDNRAYTGEFNNSILFQEVSHASAPDYSSPTGYFYPLATGKILDSGTISFWVKLGTYQDATDIFYLNIGDIKINFSYGYSNTRSFQVGTDSKSFTDPGISNWVHFYLIWGTGNVKLYLNNILAASSTSAFTAGELNFTFIGWKDESYSFLDNIKIWDSIVTEDMGIIKQIGDSENYVNIVTGNN